jgi:soluble lytic murein transglycosylase-like protein
VTRPTAIGLGYTAENYTTPSNQIYGAANYVSQMLKRFKGDYTLAIAAYNAGPGALDTFLRTGERTGNLAKGGAYAGAEGSQTETYISKVLGFDGDLLTYGRGVLGIQPPEDNATAGGP